MKRHKAIVIKYNLNRETSIEEIVRICVIEKTTYGQVSRAIDLVVPKPVKDKRKDPQGGAHRTWWTDEERKEAHRLHKAGWSWQKLANKFNRTEGAIKTIVYTYSRKERSGLN